MCLCPGIRTIQQLEPGCEHLHPAVSSSGERTWEDKRVGPGWAWSSPCSGSQCTRRRLFSEKADAFFKWIAILWVISVSLKPLAIYCHDMLLTVSYNIWTYHQLQGTISGFSFSFVFFVCCFLQLRETMFHRGAIRSLWGPISVNLPQPHTTDVHLLAWSLCLKTTVSKNASSSIVRSFHYIPLYIIYYNL